MRIYPGFSRRLVQAAVRPRSGPPPFHGAQFRDINGLSNDQTTRGAMQASSFSLLLFSSHSWAARSSAADINIFRRRAARSRSVLSSEETRHVYTSVFHALHCNALPPGGSVSTQAATLRRREISDTVPWHSWPGWHRSSTCW